MKDNTAKAQRHLIAAARLMQEDLEQGRAASAQRKALNFKRIGEKFEISPNAVQSLLNLDSSPQRYGLDSSDLALIEELDRERCDSLTREFHFSKKRVARRVGLPLMTMMRVIAMAPTNKEGQE